MMIQAYFKFRCFIFQFVAEAYFVCLVMLVMLPIFARTFLHLNILRKRQILGAL